MGAETGVGARAGPPAAASEGASLPAVLVRMPRGQVSVEEFRAALLAAATRAPGRFGLGECFLRHSMLVMEAVKLAIKAPLPSQVAGRIRRQEERAGGARMLEQQLASRGLTRADLRGLVREELLLEAITRLYDSQPPGAEVSAERSRSVYQRLRAQYAPVFHGLGTRQRAATVGGVNFTAREVVDFLLQWGARRQLAAVLQRLVDGKLVLAEAHERGLKASDPERALMAMLGPELARPRLLAYLRERREDYTLLHLAHVFFAFDPRPGCAYRAGGAVSARARAAARLRAQAVLEELKEKKIDFAAAARRYSNCPSASRDGDLGFVAPAAIAAGLPPRAYALDLVRTRNRVYSPIRRPPAPEILAAARNLADGGVSGIVQTSTGFSIVKRIESRAVQNPELLLPLCRRRRFLALRRSLLVRLRQGVKYAWRP